MRLQDAANDSSATVGSIWRNWLRRIGVMTAKEVIQFIRDAMLMGVVIYAFTFGVQTAGTSVSMQTRACSDCVHRHRSLSGVAGTH